MTKSFLEQIKARFAPALQSLVGDEIDDLLAMIRPAQDEKFGDYQVNCAMPLKGRLGKPPRDIAQQLLDAVDLDDLCSNVEVAGPGFINLTLNDVLLKSKLRRIGADSRLGVAPTEQPRTLVIDFSSPNVAKEMHVGHIRSTVIGDALARILRFIGHRVITDNHLGDWGTQFGMIIYGFKHFLNEQAYQQDPVTELGRLYKLVRQFMDYHAARQSLPQQQELLTRQETQLDELKNQQANDELDPPAAKKLKKNISALVARIQDQRQKVERMQQLLADVEADPQQLDLARQHTRINTGVLQETADLHAGDEHNYQLWREILKYALRHITTIYERLDVQFDHQLGESHYQPMLPGVVQSLQQAGLVQQSDGAQCVFLSDFETPMIIQKSDGAYLYATTDLATIKYRVENWNPDVILYVVDHRQHEHFEKLFAVARLWGFDSTEFRHISFGTVLGKDRRPFKTRSGAVVGLNELLDEAESRALQIVAENDDAKPDGPELSDADRKEIAQVVGTGALKYADLAHNRTSDYVFDYDKMIALRGNTGAYLQYCYARVQGIFRKLNTDGDSIRHQPADFQFTQPIERTLALKLLRFSEALEDVAAEYKPNFLTAYLFDLSETFFIFYNQCSIKDAESDEIRQIRLQVCDLVGRTIQTGLNLLGIATINRM